MLRDDLSWAAWGLFVVGLIVVGAGAFIGTLTALWRRQEKRDGLRD
jgi:hypothetical protein